MDFQYGIPEWIVRLRHDATHSSLPCLDTLAKSATWALDYLKKQFWECQMSSDQDLTTKEGEDEEMVADMEKNKLNTRTKNDNIKKPPPRMRLIRKAISNFQKTRFEVLLFIEKNYVEQ